MEETRAPKNIQVGMFTDHCRSERKTKILDCTLRTKKHRNRNYFKIKYFKHICDPSIAKKKQSYITNQITLTEAYIFLCFK